MQNLLELRKILDDRRLSRLYIEIYKKPTGFHSIETLQKGVEEQNLEIEKYRPLIKNFDEIIQEDQKKFELDAIYYFCAKVPFLINHLKEEARSLVGKIY